MFIEILSFSILAIILFGQRRSAKAVVPIRYSESVRHKRTPDRFQ